GPVERGGTALDCPSSPPSWRPTEGRWRADRTMALVQHSRSACRRGRKSLRRPRTVTPSGSRRETRWRPSFPRPIRSEVPTSLEVGRCLGPDELVDGDPVPSRGSERTARTVGDLEGPFL